MTYSFSKSRGNRGEAHLNLINAQTASSRLNVSLAEMMRPYIGCVCQWELCFRAEAVK